MTVRVEETPPLTRGRLGVVAAVTVHSGNTPAYAGKTQARSPRAPSERKHPRLRGEDKKLSAKPSDQRETPPLTRGRRVRAFGNADRSGNTPAYAGKTAPTGRAVILARKHPRLRGEDKPGAATLVHPEETPPLTRGRLGIRTKAQLKEGNTPAYAGKTD